jgi:hypothetical protein
VLAGIGAGTVTRFARADLLAAGHLDGTHIEAYLDFLDRFDPRHHVPGYRGRLLIQYGTRDDVVTDEDAARLRAAAPTAQWAEYDWGHGLEHPPARRDRAAFLLGTPPSPG